MNEEIKNLAFIAPRMSRDLSEYFEGILDVVKDNPSIFLHYFTFSDHNLATLAGMDGIISYTIPPPEVMAVFGKHHPPMVAITMCKPTIPSLAYAHIDPNGVAEKVVNLLVRRHCRSYAFCSPQAPYFVNESAALLSAYRRQVSAQTRQTAQLFRPISTLDPNLITSEVERFTDWLAKVPKPCGMFVHGDDTARKVLDTCRLKGIKVPDELRVIGTGNSPIFCERTFPTLSSYAINHVKSAAEAARTLLRLMAGKLTPSTASYEIPLPDVTERASTTDERGSARLAHEARAFIGEQLRRGHAPSNRDISFHLGVSIRKIEQDFRAVVGHSLHEEIVDQRLDLLCKSLCSSNEPIKVLIARCGYRDMSQATRAFKSRFGMTMGEYRQNHHS